MQIHIADSLSALLLKLYTQNLVFSTNANEEESVSILCSVFTEIAIDLANTISTDCITLSSLITRVKQLTDNYLSIDYPSSFMKLTSQVELNLVNEKVYLHLHQGETEYMYRQSEKLLMVPSFVTIKSNNISLSEEQSFEVSFKGMDEDKVLTNLSSVIHNAYLNSFTFPGLINTSEFTNIYLMGRSKKGEPFDIFNIPSFDIKENIVVDVRYLTSRVTYKLASYIKSKNTTSNLVFIGPRRVLQNLKVEHYPALSTESYIVSL